MKEKSPDFGAAHRIKVKQQRRVAFQQSLAKLRPEQIEKLRYDALRAAHNHLPRGTDPQQVVGKLSEILKLRFAS